MLKKKIVTAVKFKDEYHAATWHDVYGDWRFFDISEFDLRIETEFLYSLIESEKIINFSDIAWKGKNLHKDLRGKNCFCCGGKRYELCDTSFPGIIVEGAPNPFNLKYRLVDGKHRIEKLISEGKTKSLFNIIKYERVKFNLKPIVEQWEEANRDSCQL